MDEEMSKNTLNDENINGNKFPNKEAIKSHMDNPSKPNDNYSYGYITSGRRDLLMLFAPDNDASNDVQTPDNDISNAVQTPDNDTSNDVQTPDNDTLCDIPTPDNDTSCDVQTPDNDISCDVQTPDNVPSSSGDVPIDNQQNSGKQSDNSASSNNKKEDFVSKEGGGQLTRERENSDCEHVNTLDNSEQIRKDDRSNKSKHVRDKLGYERIDTKDCKNKTKMNEHSVKKQQQDGQNQAREMKVAPTSQELNKTEVGGQKNSSSSYTNKIGKPKMCLRFHVILSSEDLHKYGSVRLRLLHYFKQHLSQDGVMTNREIFGEGIEIMRYEVNIPKEDLVGKTISYRYNFSKDSHYEFQYDFSVLNKFKELNISDWNIYDICLPLNSPKGLFSKLKSYISAILHNPDNNSNVFLLLYHELFQKILNDNPGGGREFVLEFICVYGSAKRLSIKSPYINKTHLEKMVVEILRGLIKPSNEDRLSRASCILFILMDCDIWDEDIYSQLCTWLSIRSNDDGDDQKCLSYEHFCEVFPDKLWKRRMANTLLKFLKRIVSEDQVHPNWILVLPFLHFLEGKSRPFEELEIVLNHSDCEWWGVSSINDLVDICKKKMSKNMPLLLYLQNVTPMFEVDHLLPRSLLAIMSLHHIPCLIESNKFPLDACLANIIYFLKICNRFEESEKKLIAECLTGVKHLMEDLKKCKRYQRKHKLDEYSNYIFKLTFQLFEFIMSKCFEVDVELLAIGIMTAAVGLALGCDDESGNKDQKDKANRLVDDLLNGTRPFIEKCGKYKDTICFKVSLLISSELLEPTPMWDAVQGRIKQYFVDEFGKMIFKDKCDRFSEIMNSTNHSVIKGWTSEIMLQEVENWVKRSSGEFGIVFEYDNDDNFRGIFDEIIKQIWPVETANNLLILEFIMNTPIFPKLLNLYKVKNLGEESGIKLSRALSLLEDVERLLISGDLKIESANILLNNLTKFLNTIKSVCELENGDQRQRENLIRNSLDKYKACIEAFEKRCKQIRILLNLCDKFCTDELKAFKIEVSTEISQLCLLDICGDETTSLEIMKIEIELNEVLTFLECYQQSLVLTDLWKHYSGEMSLSHKYTLNDIIDIIYKPSRVALEKIIKSLTEGIMFLNEVERIFLNFTGCNLEGELRILCKTDLYDEIYQRILNCKCLCKCKKGAKIMLKFKEKFELTGSFEDIEKIADVTERGNLKLCDITDEFVRGCKVLRDFTDIKIRCLEVFIEEKEFVDWLRNTLSGSREIKVLVDLALMSAEGQGDLEMEKVSCLHAAATAYSSLIYDLKKDMGFREFLELCQPVWSISKVDSKIAEKFRDAAHQLEWFIGIKESHGAVEVNALEDAAVINSKGIFTVGNFANNASLLTLEDVVQMKLYLKKGEKNLVEQVSEILDSEKWKIYSLRQLCDLQSKLMLVAGKAQEGREDIEGFNRKLDGILRLAGIYLELVGRGCCMFISWKITFFCDPNKSIYARIDFSSNDQSSEPIYGKSSPLGNTNIHERIENMCDVLEKCSDEWNDYIKNKRLKNHFINFFTTKQLVVLQREIAAAINDQNDTKLGIELFMLLSFISSSCSKNDLLSAITSASQEFSKSNINKKQDCIVNISSDEDSRSYFVKAMVEAGFSSSLAKAAERNLSSGDIRDGIIWCMDNEENFEPTEQIQLHRENLQYGKINFHDFLQEETKNLGKKSISDKIGEKFVETWRIFLERVDIGFIDYISLEQLSLVLENLGKKNDRNFSRALPLQMKSGKANLLVCDENEIWITVLSIYATSLDLPLPTADEVLVCSQNTSAEEIEIMCWRAKQDKSCKLYCLVRAELLDYRVAVSAEKFINLIGDNTKFVVVCTSSTHSHIADAFDQHKVKYLCNDVTEIQNYVKHHLIQKDSRYSFVDPEHCSVRIIKSNQAGTGKTLRVKRAVDKISKKINGRPSFLTLPLHNKEVNVSEIVKCLRQFATNEKNASERIIHFDISSEVMEGVDNFLFNLLILGSLSDENGYVWRKLNEDIYFVENCPLKRKNDKKSPTYLHKIFSLLPCLNCWSPNESLKIMKNKTLDEFESDQKLDDEEFKSESIQRVCGYLESAFKPSHQKGPIGSIELLVKFCGVENPSWAELKNFINFFNHQLLAYENSIFCQTIFDVDLPGFKKFVIDFMLLMSQDFSTRSLKISEESPGMISDVSENMNDGMFLGGYEMKRTWETSSHPYLFFNADRTSFTFIGFVVDRASGNIINPENDDVLLRSAVSLQLFDALQRNNVNIKEDFDRLDRSAKLKKMATIMGLDEVHDPDENYELTADNVKKMMAIYMRFRCGIPVVIMGETGCGKTCLIKYLCNFMKPALSDIKNMFLMKIHGGTTIQNIVDKIRRAIKIAKENSMQVPGIKTVLFFDEANTTSAIGLIKEAMCDQAILGEPFDGDDLKLVAACNPYKKHSNALISKLEKAGLGYHVSANKTTDRLGTIPMRQLVYRVRSLPPSMFPLVWDFGLLDNDAERLYIKQMVHRCVERMLNSQPNSSLVSSLTEILVASQGFMRNQNDECSFVSLRDVDRCLKVMVWFHNNSQIFDEMDEILSKKNPKIGVKNDEDSDAEARNIDDLSRSLILALGVCYHACLSRRKEYRTFIAPFFSSLCTLLKGPETILEEISTSQDVFLKEVELDKNIACNLALKENLFAMVICIELRIPLFLIGKPGSSKSLAKTVVADAMQGSQSKSKLFRGFKSAHMVSYQCSPLSTPEGITGVFKQCAKLQESKDLDKFVSIVVLDEVGLAEDSEKMPLKALHPLLEDGCEDEDDSLPHKKVAFIGISNWSLDPAKMNRGIFVQRSSPDEEELVSSACGICLSDMATLKHCRKLFKPLAKGYLKLCETALEIREFFGLRDFYSLIKMISSLCKSIHRTPSWNELQKPILRNFSGLENIDVLDMFRKFVREVIDTNGKASEDGNLTATLLIRESLNEVDLDSESRYLLILMDNYSSFNLLQHELLQMNEAKIIFGSSFPKDLEYTQICRNINRIKIYMETGKTVILLNLENLYESLYDALNQYYVKFGDQRFVDLGLGTQRVKCKVHKSFRLIVVADKQVVYKRFPIPLINRLEKHCLAVESLLTSKQMDISKELKRWADKFTRVTDQVVKSKNATLPDVFIGFHLNAPASLVLQASSKLNKCKNSNEQEILEHCQHLLLQCAVPEAVIRRSDLEINGKDVNEIYFKRQYHNSIMGFLQSYIIENENQKNIFAQITTHSRLLLKTEVSDLTMQLGLPPQSMEVLSLQAFATEQQFSGELKSFFESEMTSILIIQCDSGDQNGDLIACARFIVGNEYSNWERSNDKQILKHVLLIIQLPKVMGGCFVGFQGGRWLSYHIDNLQPDPSFMALLPQMKDKSISSLLNSEQQEQPHKEEGNQQTEATNKIIENCIHAAAALLKSNAENLRSRKAARLDPLIRNLHKTSCEDNRTLVDILKDRVSQLLLEREEKVTFSPKSWLMREASTLEAVCSAGSFGNAVIQCMESKITPILAYIIAYVDSYCNLDLLNSDDEFVVNLWFRMFRNSDITSMKYGDIQTISRSMEVLQFEVKTFTQDGSLMKCQLPFSFLIKENLDQLISKHLFQDEWMEKNKFDIEDIFSSTEVGKLLNQFSEIDGCSQKIFEMYLFDYIKMSYRPSSVQVHKEVEVVAEDLRNILMPITRMREFQDDFDNFWTLSKIHFTYKEHLLKYKLFAEFVSCCPDCIDVLSDAKPNNMTLSQKCLMYILKNLNFSTNVKCMMSWANKVRSFTHVIDQFFEHVGQEELKIDFNGSMCAWNRICAFKLFIDHNSSNELLDKDNYNKLWSCMGEQFNLKIFKCFENIEKYLKICDVKGFKKVFGKILPSKCCTCEDKNGIINLKCEHNYCQECFDELSEFHNGKCAVCRDVAEKKGNHLISKDDMDKYVAFKRKLNSFFMALVSKMCFDGGDPPDDKIINVLLHKVVFKSETDSQLRTRNLMVGRNDPSPIVRSFLLQLLLKHRMDSVEIHLTKFLEDAQLVSKCGINQILELDVLCLNCFEDHYQNLGAKRANLTDRLEFAKSLWKENKLIDLCQADDKNNVNLDVKKLKKLAILRYGLKELAEGLHSCYIEKVCDDCINLITRSLGDLAANIFRKNYQAKLYLMKEIVHKFGFKTLLQFAEEPRYRWLITTSNLDDKREENALDHFLLCRGNYKDTRDSLFQALLQNNPSLLDQMNLTDYDLALSLFRHLSRSTAKAENDGSIWIEYFSEKENLIGKDLIKFIMERKLKMVIFKPIMMHLDSNLIDLIFHFMVATKCMQSRNHVIDLLCIPMNSPGTVKNTYLPTMPEDTEFEALQLVNQKEQVMFYRCPNNHTYSIGDCGKPAFISRCPACGQIIGGQNHVPAPGNRNAILSDSTQPGHILGRPNNLNIPSGERLMTPLEVCITRLLLHISLYIGSFDHDFSMDSIKPLIKAHEVHEYFLGYVDHDLNMVQRSSGQNRDNAIILLHEIIRNIYYKKIDADVPLNLTSKAGRMKWEAEFVKEYIRPHLENVNELIENGRKLMLGDDLIVLSPLMKEIYEVNQDNSAPESLENLQSCQLLWKYRVRITSEHLLINLQNSKFGAKSEKEGGVKEKQYCILQYFLENSNILQEIRRLPAILDLHRRLRDSLSRRISIDEAKTCSVSEFLKQKDEMTRENLKSLFEEFCVAWNNLRFKLSNFAFQKTAIPEIYLNQHLDHDSMIGFFLPTIEGFGVCSIGLISFLTEQQNKLLDVYERVVGKKVAKIVSMEECTSTHLLMLEPEKELHTIILASCNYSLQVGQLMKLECDYASLESQIIDQFVFNKPRIKSDIKFINYKEDFNVSRIFDELENKIPQETKLPSPLENDFKILSDVSMVLPCFTSVLEFIVSVERDQNKNIVDFMTNTLRMKNMFEDFPSMTSLQFKHAKHAWLTLSFIQTKLQVKNGQLPFWNVDKKYKETMPNSVHLRLENSLQWVRVELLSFILFECILLEVAFRVEDDFDNSRQSLCDILLAYISANNLDERCNSFLEKTFPKEILACHCIDAWLSMVDPEKRNLLN